MNRIEKTYCINLDERHDRWNRVQREFQKLDINVERFSGIRKAPGFAGCKESHLEVLKLCQTYKIFMILEDDVCFLDHALTFINKALSQLPDNWDMLYLGVNPQQKLTRYSENLFHVRESWTTHAMIFNNQNNIIDAILDMAHKERKIDVLYARKIQRYFRCFVTYPLAATQYNSISNIVKGEVDYYHTIINGFKKHI